LNFDPFAQKPRGKFFIKFGTDVVQYNAFNSFYFVHATDGRV